MTMLDSELGTGQADARALIEQARRHQRRRRWWTAGSVAVAVASSGVGYAIVSGIGNGQNPSIPKGKSPSHGAVPVGHRVYQQCPGSAQVGPATSPDGLPAMASRTDDLTFVTLVAEHMAKGDYLGFTHQIAGLPVRENVSSVQVGPGGGYVWMRKATGQAEVVRVKNYGINLYLKAPSDCPTGGWARWSNGGVQITFLAPK
jgi:hypothetical protein